MWFALAEIFCNRVPTLLDLVRADGAAPLVATRGRRTFLGPLLGLGEAKLPQERLSRPFRYQSREFDPQCRSSSLSGLVAIFHKYLVISGVSGTHSIDSSNLLLSANKSLILRVFLSL